MEKNVSNKSIREDWDFLRCKAKEFRNKQESYDKDEMELIEELIRTRI